MNQLPLHVYELSAPSPAARSSSPRSSPLLLIGVASLQASPTLLSAPCSVIVVYVLGQIVANVAGDLIERRIVRKRLRTPADVLLGNRNPGK